MKTDALYVSPDHAGMNGEKHCVVVAEPVSPAIKHLACNPKLLTDIVYRQLPFVVDPEHLHDEKKAVLRVWNDGIRQISLFSPALRVCAYVAGDLHRILCQSAIMPVDYVASITMAKPVHTFTAAPWAYSFIRPKPFLCLFQEICRRFERRVGVGHQLEFESPVLYHEIANKYTEGGYQPSSVVPE